MRSCLLLLTGWSAAAEGVTLQRPNWWPQRYHLPKNYVSSFCSSVFFHVQWWLHHRLHFSFSSSSSAILCRWLCTFSTTSLLNSPWWPPTCLATSSGMSANPPLPTCLVIWMIFLTFPLIPRKLLKHSWLYFIGPPKRHLPFLGLTHPLDEYDSVRNYQILSITWKIYI